MTNKHETKIDWTHIPGYTGATWNPFTGNGDKPIIKAGKKAAGDLLDGKRHKGVIKDWAEGLSRKWRNKP
jgi:hypothetical protein